MRRKMTGLLLASTRSYVVVRSHNSAARCVVSRATTAAAPTKHVDGSVYSRRDDGNVVVASLSRWYRDTWQTQGLWLPVGGIVTVTTVITI